MKSADNRLAMEKRFGFIPLSILKLSRGGLSKSVFNYATERALGKAREGRIKADRHEKEYAPDVDKHAAGSGGVRGAGMSIMPAEIVEFFIKYYAKPGEVYLDLFMGQGVQMQVAHAMGLHYYGYDLSVEFFGYIESVRNKISNGTAEIQIFNADSRYPNEIQDGIGDFSFYSPPYWDIEYYGDEPGQLGKNTYSDFIQGMQDVAAAWLPKFKRGAYHVVNVNDFRKDGVFYPYHADTIGLFRRAGWVLTDTWIIEGLVGGLPKAFGVDFNLKRIAPKVHEYALVFRKP